MNKSLEKGKREWVINILKHYFNSLEKNKVKLKKMKIKFIKQCEKSVHDIAHIGNMDNAKNS